MSTSGPVKAGIVLCARWLPDLMWVVVPTGDGSGSPRVRWRLASYGRSRLGHAALPHRRPRPRRQDSDRADQLVRRAHEARRRVRGGDAIAVFVPALARGAAREAEARRGGEAGAPRPAVAPSRDRPGRLHRQRVVHQRLSRGEDHRPHRRRGDAAQRVEVHRPRQVRGRVPGRRDQAGVRRSRAGRGAARGRRALRDQPARRPHRRRARGHGPHQERADPGDAGRGAPQRYDRAPRGRRRRHRRRHRRRRTGRDRDRGGLPSRRPLLRAARTGHGGRHGRALPAPEAGDDRERRPAVLRQVRPQADPQRRAGHLVHAGDDEGGHHRPRENQAHRSRRRQGRLSGHHRQGCDRGAPGRARDRPAGNAAQDGRARRGAREGRLPARRSAPVCGQARAGRGRGRLRARGGDPARRRDRRRGRDLVPEARVRALPSPQQATHRRPPQERAHPRLHGDRRDVGRARDACRSRTAPAPRRPCRTTS